MAFPAVIVVVGMHFFVMPASYRYRANLITGAVLIVSAVLSAIFFKGDRMIAVAALCAGITLWASATYALTFAGRQCASLRCKAAVEWNIFDTGLLCHA